MDRTTCEVSYLSADKKTEVHACVWTPQPGNHIKGIVQLVHGMSEYIERYRDFARFLNDAGFVVCGNDHIGHGQSVACKEDWGNLPLKGGAQVLVDDVHTLRGTMQKDHPGVPYFIFGHSMGSFVVRKYLATYAEGLAGAVVCGTSQQPASIVSRAGGALARLIAGVKGSQYRSALLDGIGAGAYAKQIEDARTPFDWINTSSACVDEYIADEACGFMFTVGGYATLTDLTAEVVTPACAAAVPAGLPVLFIGGSKDPVGSCGKGVREAAECLSRNSGARVETKIYDDMRHEILNEPEHERVYNDVLNWMEQVIEDHENH